MPTHPMRPTVAGMAEPYREVIRAAIRPKVEVVFLDPLVGAAAVALRAEGVDIGVR